MGATACGLVAGLIDWIEGRHSDQGRPRCPTEAVVETLRFFLREGVQWRELRATGDRVCGATLRRRLMEWSAEALLHRVHAALIRMVRSGPEAAAAAWDVVIDSCSVRAKRGGELTGPNPTDRAKRGTKYHVLVASDGIPLAALPSAANVHDTMSIGKEPGPRSAFNWDPCSPTGASRQWDSISTAVLEAPALVTGFDDVAVMSQS